MEQALTLAKPNGYVRLFADEGEAMARLLNQLPGHPYTPYLLQEMNPAEHPLSRPLSTAPVETLAEPLTDRELQIFCLMAARLSNREIAEELYLATTTIKWYSRQIYSKLGVNGRRQAVESARELAILS